MLMRNPLRTLVFALLTITALTAARNFVESGGDEAMLEEDITVPAARVARDPLPELADPVTIVEPNENWLDHGGSDETHDVSEVGDHADRYLAPPTLRTEPLLRR